MGRNTYICNANIFVFVKICLLHGLIFAVPTQIFWLPPKILKPLRQFFLSKLLKKISLTKISIYVSRMSFHGSLFNSVKKIKSNFNEKSSWKGTVQNHQAPTSSNGCQICFIEQLLLSLSEASSSELPRLHCVGDTAEQSQPQSSHLSRSPSF